MRRGFLFLLLASSACFGGGDRPTLFEKAFSLEQMGKTRDAIDLYQKAVAADPQDEDSWYNLGRLYASLGHAKMAAKAFQRCLEINPLSADALCNLGILAEKAGDPGKARKLYEAAAQKAPHRAFPEVLSARLEAKQGHLLKAKKLLQEALHRNPQSSFAWHEKGRLLLGEGRPTAAFSALEEALKRDGESDPILKDFAKTATLIGAHDKALLALQRLTAKHPSEALWFAKIATTQLARMKPNRAFLAITRALALAPKNKNYRSIRNKILQSLSHRADSK